MIKEEIKCFLANRRISQAVVAQVTGECRRPPRSAQATPRSHERELTCLLTVQISPLLPPPGISQSRISHWLLQQGSDLSEQKKRAFFRWYQLEKSNPGNATLRLVKEKRCQ